MLITKTVIAKWTRATRKHYESKGYKWTKLHDTFEIKTEDLPEKSCMYIMAKCDFCNQWKKVRYSVYKASTMEHDGKYCCNKCSSKVRDSLKYEFVKGQIEKHEGYKLLSKEYKNGSSKLKISCDKGHIYETTYDSIRQGSKCPICFELYGNRGGLNPNYNPNLTDEEREANKSRHTDKYYRRWYKAVFKRDNYTCCKCNERGVILNAHHIESFGTNIEQRLDINNGVTLCEDCHKDFHKIYGYGNNNSEQYEEWINKK